METKAARTGRGWGQGRGEGEVPGWVLRTSGMKGTGQGQATDDWQSKRRHQ